MGLIKIAFAGNSDNFEAYRKVLDRHNEYVTFSGAWFPADKPENYSDREFSSLEDLHAESDAVIFLGKTRRKIISDSIKALKHIFIEDYDVLMNAEVKYMSDLAEEAKIMAQISFPKIYFWGIEDIVDEYPMIRNIFFNREYLYLQQRQEVDIIPEIMSSIMLVGEDVVRASQSFYPLISKRTEMQIVNLEFVTKATSTITGIPVGFFEKHDLRIIAERNLAYIDLRKREWHSLRPAKAITGNLIKGIAGLPEVGDLEQFELQDFIYSIKENSKPFISLEEIVRLYSCMKLLLES
jgi:predicted dehydrogenase